MKIIIDELLPEFQKFHPDIQEIMWDEQKGVQIVISTKSGKRYFNKSDYAYYIPVPFQSQMQRLFDKAQQLVDDFIGM